MQDKTEEGLDGDVSVVRRTLIISPSIPSSLVRLLHIVPFICLRSDVLYEAWGRPAVMQEKTVEGLDGDVSVVLILSPSIPA